MSSPGPSSKKDTWTRPDSDDDMDSDGDDDPIVKRLPVYYTPHYLSSLTLLQYPDRPPRPNTHHPLLPPSLRPAGSGDPGAKISARYKPKSQHLEIEIPIERDPERWNEDDAKEFGRGMPEPEGKGKEKEKKKGRQRKVTTEEEEEERKRLEEEREARRLDKIVLGSQAVPDVTNYLVGVVKDDSLHLTPLTSTFQLRPKLTYLDNIIVADRRAKREAHRNKDSDSDGEGEISDTELKKEAAKAVQVSVKQSEASGAPGKAAIGPGNGRAGASLFEPLRAEEGESWIGLQHYHADTPQASLAFDHMFAQEENQSTQLKSITKPLEYLKG
ncbi:DNA-directed RNA polymerase III subunit RPC5-like protein [Pseudohyphozyma bogoriensis]|nr:DNA-directed RNA polymerase III subunit RPC5-like protein [Pseudohyphozyma bogoriensis]